MWRLRPGIRLSVEEWIRPHGPTPQPPQHHRWTIVTEDHGFRTDPFATEKPDGTFRVLCLGDSRTLGEGLAQDQTYPSQLQRHLGEDTEVLNLGADGWSAYQGRTLLEREAVRFQPDVVIACFGINDTDRAWGQFDPERATQMNTLYTRVQRQLYRSMLFYAGTRVYLTARAALFGRTPVTSGYGEGAPRLTPEMYAAEIRRIEALCRRNDASLIILILPVNPYYPWDRGEDDSVHPFDAYNSGVKTGPWTTVDLTESELVRSAPDAFLDDMHPSPGGAAIVAHHLYNAIRPMRNSSHFHQAPETID